MQAYEYFDQKIEECQESLELSEMEAMEKITSLVKTKNVHWIQAVDELLSDFRKPEFEKIVFTLQ